MTESRDRHDDFHVDSTLLMTKIVLY
jgi:hypothetical protein